MTSTPHTRGIHHLGLTVSDVQQSATFFCEQLGYTVVGEKPDYPAIFVSDGHIMLTLWQVSLEGQAIGFDRRRHVGLHHVALNVAGADELDRLFHRLSALPGVEIEFAPELLGQSGATHMMCTIPGGPRVEFIAAA